MVKLGKSSKRTPVRLRHKIEKASAAKQRKDRKLAKKNPQWRSKLKKDPGIPNLFPYKDRLLQEIEEKRRLKAEEAQKLREEAKLRRQAQNAEEAGDVDITENADLIDDEDDELIESDDDDMEVEGEESNPMAALLASAKARAAEYEDQHGDEDMVDDEEDAFKEVIDRADIDLVPPPVLKGWLVYLRRYFPTLPLRASSGAPNAHTFDHKQLTVKGTSETLFKALKAYAHDKQLKRAVSVGVIGGNANVCPVGAEAGVTTSLREVKLDSKLKVIDSPGIVFPNAEKPKSSESRKIKEQARLILLNAIPPKQISDPVPAVTLLLKRLSASEGLLSKMLDFYGIPPLFPTNGDKTTDFLIQVARRRGRLGRGGTPNINSAATTVITDWRDGRIQGWLEAPALPVSTAVENDAVGEASGPAADTKQIVTEWAKEFKLEGLWGDDAVPEDNDEQMKE
ncbi:P-loop containing nucleoside triphosphate hydrolase [Trichophyton rubrum]|nr:P-loop containing nucleoside triphosphate hydrolase [Trichophyton rubrum]